MKRARFRQFLIAGACMMLVLACGTMENQPQQKTVDLIPAPVEVNVLTGEIKANELANLPEKIRISEKALLRHLEGKNLTDWQLKSAYRMEIGKKNVKIVASDQEGVFYAQQSLKMMASLDSTIACCTILDWPRFQYRGIV